LYDIKRVKEADRLLRLFVETAEFVADQPHPPKPDKEVYRDLGRVKIEGKADWIALADVGLGLFPTLLDNPWCIEVLENNLTKIEATLKRHREVLTAVKRLLEPYLVQKKLKGE